MKLYKYQALGNDYLILDHRLPENTLWELTPNSIIKLCNRNFGVGADGIIAILNKPLLAIRIYNPDGSQAEVSGNGARILAQFLMDQGEIKLNERFELNLTSRQIQGVIKKSQEQIIIEMGRAYFSDTSITSSKAASLLEAQCIDIQGKSIDFHTCFIGNPHCVIFQEALARDEVLQLGPFIECHPRFPNRTNVQFVKVRDKHTLELEIWERGAGYTLASGSSSCAAAAVAYRLGLCLSPIQVHMPGGILTVYVDAEYGVQLEGGAKGIFHCDLLSDYLSSLTL